MIHFVIPLFLSLVSDPGERDLLIEYYTSHRYTMLHVAQSILRDKNLAEDAVQEAFCRVALNIKRIRPDPNDVRAYLVTIVRNISLDMVKQKKVLSLDDIAYDAPGSANVEAETEQREAAHAAERLVLSMPHKYSTVFLLRYKHDCSIKNIADLLEISEGAVYKRLQRAKKLLAKAS